MERSGDISSRILEARNSRMNFIREVPVEDLLDQTRRDIFLRSDTNVNIFSRERGDVIDYALQFDKPLKSSDLIRMLRNFTDTPFNPKTVANIWGGYDEGIEFVDNPTWGLINLLQQQIPLLKVRGEELGQILESDDDSEFLKSVARGIKTTSSAWNELVRNEKFDKSLRNKFMSGSLKGMGFDENIQYFLESYIESSSEKSAERIACINRTFRESFDNEDSFLEFKDELIRKEFDIKFEYQPADHSETVFYTSADDKNTTVIVRSNSTFGVIKQEKDKDNELKDKFSAEVNISEDGFVNIYPFQEEFVIPLLAYSKRGNSRELILTNDMVFEGLPFKSNIGKNIEINFGEAGRNLNTLAGLMVAYEALLEENYASSETRRAIAMSPRKSLKLRPRIPAEVFPYAAFAAKDKMFGRKFFARVERG